MDKKLEEDALMDEKKERRGHKERRRELFRGRRGCRVRVEGDGGSIY